MKKILQKETWEGEKIKGSRFIVNVAPVSCDEDCKAFLQEIAEKYSDARHHCFAYRLSNGVFRSSDDGEPRGSAGIPILQRLEFFELVDTIVVVTRYFGGVKLGVGGLIRAYGGAAGEGLAQMPLQEMILGQKICIQCGYSDISIVQSLCKKNAILVLTEAYLEDIQIEIVLLEHLYDSFSQELSERTGGRVQAEISGQIAIPKI